MQKHKNKTFTTFLAALFGGLGVHRFYLKGGTDRLGLLHLCCLPVAGIVYGVGAGRGVNPFWMLLPVLVSYNAGFLEALILGLTSDERWDARFNAGTQRSSESHWVLAVLLVGTALIGATVLIATISRLFDLLFTGGAYG